MIYVGIDPEPSGASAFWDLYTNQIYFLSTSMNPNIRSEKFSNFLLDYIDKIELEDIKDPRIFITIEKVWAWPQQSVKTNTNFMISFGMWKGIICLFSYLNDSIPIYFLEVAPKTWKTELGLTKDKYQSYELAKKLIKDPELKINQSALNGLKLGPKVNDKQIYDRSEAFLLAYYGRMFLDNRKD